MARLWLVRLGRSGEFDGVALEQSLLTIGFNMNVDLSTARDREEIYGQVRNIFPEAPDGRAANFAAQINQFVNTMAVGDVVISPFKTLGTIGIGEVVGGYERAPNGHPSRRVKWLRTDVRRDAFHQDLLYSLGAIMTVCEIRRNDALRRVMAVAKTGKDPGDGASARVPSTTTPSVSPEEGPAAENVNLEEIARDQIERRIASLYAGHRFTELIGAILTAQGYRTAVSPPGPDAGIDIVAGKGALGFDAPRLVVQVKSGDIVVDQPTLQGLIGCVADTKADHGLLVSWSGFKPTVRKRTNELYFRVRLWGRTEIMDALLSVYEDLPEEIRADLPLRKTWTLVTEEQGGRID